MIDIDELEETGLFDVEILTSARLTLESYLLKKHNLGPDEFCIALITNQKVKKKCALKEESIQNLFDNEEIKCLRTLSVAKQTIVMDLFMSVARFEPILKSIANDLFEKRRLRNNNIYEIMVLIYVLIYRVQFLSVEESSDFCHYFKIGKLLCLASYLLCQDTLELFRILGRAIFEENFVEEHIVGPFQQNIPQLKELRLYLREQKNLMRVVTKEVTVPIVMNVLRRPKRMPFVPPPTPQDLTRIPVHAVPKSTYKAPVIKEKLEFLHVINKSRAAYLLEDANKNMPICLRRPKKQRKVVGVGVGVVVGVVEKREREILKRRAIRPQSTFKPIKQTATTILREYSRIVNDEMKEVKRLKELAEGGFDPGTIAKLEDEERQQRREEELEKLEEKRLTALLSREGAYVAKQNLLNDNKILGENVRKERQELYERLEKLREEHNKGIMESVEKCHELKEASRQAYNTMINEKRQQAAEVSEESRQLKILLAKQKEEEAQKKAQLIQEIKELHALRQTTVKDFDPTESSGLGLLCEMSLAELKERLYWTKLKLNEEMEQRKSNIQREREKKKNMIELSQKALDEYKANKRSVPTSAVATTSTTTLIAVHSSTIENLRKKLEERRAQRLQK